MEPVKPEAAATRIRIGVSSCLLGSEVRFDGGHKRDDFLTGTLGAFVEFVPLCPEVELGLGVPRESVRLARGEGGAVAMVGNKTGKDITADMRAFAERRVEALGSERLRGYVLKKDSPSCGMERVRVYGRGGTPMRDGVGLFAAALIRHYPNLPVEEEGRLRDSVLRENFIERVFAYHRLADLFEGRWTVGALVAFHTAHKLILMAHSPKAYAELGRYVANAKKTPRAEVRETYEREFMRALRKIATRARHVNVMHHMAGYLREHLDPDSRSEMLALIEDYRAAMVPLVVPLTLVRHYVRRFDIAYLKGQLYLEPHPKELMLRNHV